MPSREEIRRKQNYYMEHYIKTDKISNPYEKKKHQQAILNEMNRLHQGKGVETVNETGEEL